MLNSRCAPVRYRWKWLRAIYSTAALLEVRIARFPWLCSRWETFLRLSFAIDLETALSESGFDIRHVASGEEAIDELDRRHSEICGVVTDIRLGDKVDGWAVGRHARELIPGVRIVYMSGDSAHEHTVYGVPNSVMLQKPFAVAQLTTALATLLNTATPRELPPQVQA